ncbi:MAG: bifunctional sugar-1-phosphate nucleotidylyltransferase/acetyltransferase [Thermoplasmatota archaeon]
MRAILLAAGEGKRMRPLTANRPKPMLPVAGVPIAERLVRELVAAGVEEITLVVNFKEEAVRAHFGDGRAFGARVDYVRQGEPRGTGDALVAARLGGDPALVLYADVFLDANAVRDLVRAGPGSLAAARVPDGREYGVFETHAGRATRVVEKSPNPPSSLANAGCYHLPAGFAKHLARLAPSPRGEFELTDALNASFTADGGWRVLELANWLDVGRPWHLLAANEAALASLDARIEGKVEAGATLHGVVHVGEGSLVRAGAYIEGPVFIGRGCDIGPNCYVRPMTSIGDKCRVGNAVEVKASVLMEGVHVGHLSYVGDSVIGERSNLGAGTKVANLRHDGKTVKVTTQGARHDTGRRKMGVILGPDVHTGINTSLNVGVVLPAGATTMPGEVVMESRF